MAEILKFFYTIFLFIFLIVGDINDKATDGKPFFYHSQIFLFHFNNILYPYY
jgi:hypothetical protein